MRVYIYILVLTSILAYFLFELFTINNLLLAAYILKTGYILRAYILLSLNVRELDLNLIEPNS